MLIALYISCTHDQINSDETSFACCRNFFKNISDEMSLTLREVFEITIFLLFVETIGPAETVNEFIKKQNQY